MQSLARALKMPRMKFIFNNWKQVINYRCLSKLFCIAISSRSSNSTLYMHAYVVQSSCGLSPTPLLHLCLLIHLRPSLPASLSGGTRMEAASVEYSTSDTAFIRFCALSVSISVASLSDSGSAVGNSVDTMDSQRTSKGGGQFLTLRDNVWWAIITGNWQAEQANLLIQKTQNCI